MASTQPDYQAEKGKSSKSNKGAGWICLHRKIQEHWLYKEDRIFSRWEAFEYLLLQANHADRKVLIDGNLITVHRGSFITSQQKLARIFRWSKNKLVRFLNLLVSEAMIELKTDQQKTLIIILNYSKYQSIEAADGPTDETANETPDRTPSGLTDGPTDGLQTTIITIKNNDKQDLSPERLPLSENDRLSLLCNWWQGNEETFADDCNAARLQLQRNAEYLNPSQAFAYMQIWHRNKAKFDRSKRPVSNGKAQSNFDANMNVLFPEGVPHD